MVLGSHWLGGAHVQVVQPLRTSGARPAGHGGHAVGSGHAVQRLPSHSLRPAGQPVSSRHAVQPGSQ